MKLFITDIKEKFTIKIIGNEDWLEGIYKYFPHPENINKPLISGQLTFIKHKANLIKVYGHIQYNPYVTCSRCANLINWPINTTFNVIYTKFKNNLNKTKVYDLSTEELDEYFISKDNTIDIFELINDQIQICIPQQTFHLNPDFTSCYECNLQHSSDSPVYNTTTNTQKSKYKNPFFKLLEGIKP